MAAQSITYRLSLAWELCEAAESLMRFRSASKGAEPRSPPQLHTSVALLLFPVEARC